MDGKRHTGLNKILEKIEQSNLEQFRVLFKAPIRSKILSVVETLTAKGQELKKKVYFLKTST